MTATDLAAQLPGGATPRGDGEWYDGRCPAHDDRHASLSFRDGHTSIVFRCHAGCPSGAILAALGLRAADVRLAETAANGQVPEASRIVATYDYRDTHCTLLYQAVRYEPKRFRQRRPDGRGGWTWDLNGTPRVLYRLPELVEHTQVFVVEGEKDVDRLWSLGLPATTGAMGAGKWRPEYAQQLQKAGVVEVVALEDNDRPGVAHAEAVAASCHAAGLIVRRPRLPGLPPVQAKHGEDVSDWLDDGHSADELRRVVEATPRWTPEPKPEPLTWAPVLVRLSSVQPEPVAWLWPGRLARGKLTILAGDPGLGKSYLTHDVIARLTTAAHWPDGVPAPLGRALLLSAEDGLADTVRPRIDRLGGDADRVDVMHAVGLGGRERLPCLASDLPALELALARVRPDVLVIDPLSAYLGKTDSYKDAEVRGLLAPVMVCAAKYGVAVLAVMHLTKGGADRRAIHRALGSIGFLGAARLGLVVAKDPQDEGRLLVAGSKNNLGPQAPTLAFRINDTGLAWDPDPVSGVNADELLAAGAGVEDRAEGSDADGFLVEVLAAGEVLSRELLRAARENGISERTLYRAKRRLGIIARHEGQPGKAGRWWWALPADAPKAAIYADVAAFEQPATKTVESAPASPKAAIRPHVAAFGGSLRETDSDDTLELALGAPEVGAER
jgi:hypothetical protein